MMPNSRLTYLFYRYFDGLCDDNEQKELADLLEQTEHTGEIENLMEEAWATFSAENNVFSKITSQQILSNALGKESGDAINAEETDVDTDDSPGTWFSSNWWSFAAAVLLTVGLGLYYFLVKIKATDTKPAVAQQSGIQPGGAKATLTLADGSKIILDDAKNGQIAFDGTSKIEKTGSGQLTYRANADNPSSRSYNILTTPRGGQYQILLSDGTKVWLNAASSLKYPTVFSAAERRVELNGEGYFEVAKNQKSPFRVSTGNNQIEVLGTSFNVNNYADEPLQRTTLLEGSVRIRSGVESTLLQPGNEAGIGTNQKINIQRADSEKAVAWKNGYFQFGGTPLREVMRQVMRWYDIDVTYEGEIPSREFGGEISRQSNLGEVLKILELSHIHFRVEGRKITVIP
jgi:transmembrane sensor